MTCRYFALPMVGKNRVRASYKIYTKFCNIYNNIKAKIGEKSIIPMPKPNLSKIALQGANIGSVI
jgi:hypothetical protein